MGRIGNGATALAKQVGYTQTYVSQLFKKGYTRQEVIEKARARDRKPVVGASNGSRTNAGRAGNQTSMSEKRAGAGAGALSTSSVYVPRRRRAASSSPESSEAKSESEAGPEYRSPGRPPTRIDGETEAQARLRKMRVDADYKEMEYRVRIGELVERYQIEQLCAGHIIEARDILLRMGPELRDRIAVETDPMKCEKIIDGEVRRALGKLEEMGEKVAAMAVGDGRDKDGNGNGETEGAA